MSDIEPRYPCINDKCGETTHGSQVHPHVSHPRICPNGMDCDCYDRPWRAPKVEGS